MHHIVFLSLVESVHVCVMCFAWNMCILCVACAVGVCYPCMLNICVFLYVLMNACVLCVYCCNMCGVVFML